jgi:hypothetical protein
VIIALMLALMLMLSGCNLMGSTDSLMRPPQMTEDQRELDSALKSAVGAEDIQLKYPMRGEHLSAYIPFNQRIDGTDGSRVAAFYTVGPSESEGLMLSVLSRDADSDWRALGHKAAPEGMSSVDFIAFVPMVSPEYNNLVVGWATPRGDRRRLAVYQLQGSSMVLLFDQEYSECVTVDANGDGLYELYMLTAGAQVRMARLTDNAIEVAAEEILSPIDGYRQVCYGMLTEGLGALFIDYYTGAGESRRLDTAIVTVDLDRPDGNPLSELIPAEWGIDVPFTRPEDAAVCEDIDHNGTIDIPVVTPMPGYTGREPTGSIMLTDYIGFQAGGGFGRVLSAVINQKSGYMFVLPEHWKYASPGPVSEPKVTVHNSGTWDEWSFYVFQGSRELSFSGMPLLRILVVAERDDPGDLVEQGYELLPGMRGLFRYYALIPEGSDIEFFEIVDFGLFRLL